VKYHSNERRLDVLQERIEHDAHDHDDSRLQAIKKFSFIRWIPPLNEEDDDEVHATRNDHNEGIRENIMKLPQ